MYEERIVLFDAVDSDDAIARAEVEASEYVEPLHKARSLGIYQSFHLFDPPGDAKEVFSLVRDSDLKPERYLDAFFDTGGEHQQEWGQDRPPSARRWDGSAG